jgi:hypothetical protein
MQFTGGSGLRLDILSDIAAKCQSVISEAPDGDSPYLISNDVATEKLNYKIDGTDQLIKSIF